MRANRILASALAIVLLFSTAIGCGAEKVDLQYRLQAGKTYRLEVMMDMTISQALLGQSVDMDMAVGFDYSCYVREVDAAGVASLDVTFDRVRLRMTMPTGLGAPQTLEYDSDNLPADAPPETQIFSAMVGKGYSLKLSPTGKVSEVQGIDRMVQEILGELYPGVDRAALGESFEQQMGNLGMTDNMGLALALYPGYPVGVGDSWTKDTSSSVSGISLAVETTWTLKERSEGIATIELRSKVGADPNAGPVVIEDMTVNYELSGTQQGTIEVDETTGWTIRGVIGQNISGKVETMGMSWPITMTGSVQFESPAE